MKKKKKKKSLSLFLECTLQQVANRKRGKEDMSLLEDSSSTFFFFYRPVAAILFSKIQFLLRLMLSLLSTERAGTSL